MTKREVQLEELAKAGWENFRNQIRTRRALGNKKQPAPAPWIDCDELTKDMAMLIAEGVLEEAMRLAKEPIPEEIPC